MESSKEKKNMKLKEKKPNQKMEITKVKVEKFGAIVTVALSWRKEGRMEDWRVVR